MTENFPGCDRSGAFAEADPHCLASQGNRETKGFFAANSGKTKLDVAGLSTYMKNRNW
jgi:hypothetical protein